jgi:hypothetical protein
VDRPGLRKMKPQINQHFFLEQGEKEWFFRAIGVITNQADQCHQSVIQAGKSDRSGGGGRRGLII